MKGYLGLVLPVLAAATPVVIDTIHKDAAPIVSSTNAKHIPDSYMVVFKDHVKEHHAAAHHSWVQDLHLTTQGTKNELKKRGHFSLTESVFSGLKHTYQMPGLLGYSGHFDEDVIEEVRRHPDVAYIERDSEVRTMEDDPELEKGAPWGLARISHRKSLSFSTFNKYLYSADGGEGVTAYVIDTGINIEHVDFEGRASWGKTIPPDTSDEDQNGHGTHCSGTVAGAKFGVAKKAKVVAVRVLGAGGSGSMSDVVKGVEWAANAHVKDVKAAKDGKKKGFKGSVANMSLGGGKSNVLDLAVNAAVDLGLHFAVAAGNDNANSCNYSPAAAEKAVTVGASTLNDERAYFSNYGKCNDIFAPGLNILSTWIGSKYATNSISGTSMASPHVCGLLAYMLSLQPASDSAYAVADITPKELKAAILKIGSRGMLSDVPSDTDNLLIFNGGGSSNFTKIIEGGGYTAGEAETDKFAPLKFAQGQAKKLKAEFAAELRDVIEEIEEIIERIE